MPKKVTKKTASSKKATKKTASSKKATKKTASSKKVTKKTASSKKATKKTASSKKVTKKTASSKKATSKEPNFSSFYDEINNFVAQIESLANPLVPVMKTMSDLFGKSIDSLDTFNKKKGVRKRKKDGSVLIKPSDLSRFEKIAKDLHSLSLAIHNIPQIFFCDLIHKYDAYLGRLLRVAFLVKPELLSASQRSITFADLTGFRSLKAAQESIIEKEVESVIRDSHIDQFKWMEKRFKLSLHKNLDVWPNFVEITERRNLFVHCDGIVSSQYLKSCKQEGVELDADIKVGSKLRVDLMDFQRAYDVIFEIGIKLGHVLWRKLEPDDINNADRALHFTGYELLKEDQYDLSKILLHFATDTLKKSSSDLLRRQNFINLCIAYKFSGDKQKCDTLLNSEDWTACGPEFRMAVAVLKDKYTEAVEIMNSIGAKGAVNREEYSTWPLFKKFRTSKEFLSAYHNLFGEEFVLPEDDEVIQAVKSHETD